MSSGGEKEDYIKCEQIGGGSPRHLNNLSYLFIVDCTHVGSANSFLRGLGNIAKENTTADILIEDQLWPPLDTVTVDQERELHKSKTNS